MNDSDRPSTVAGAIGRDKVAYTVAEAARLLSLSKRQIEYMVAKGALPSFKVGRARRIAGADLEAYATAQRNAA